jgi:hypothetical protein
MPLGRLTRYLWTKSPRDYWNRLAAAPHDDYKPWESGKHRQWNRLPYYLQLFDRCAAQTGHPFKLTGARLLEIGAGPVLGLIPFALVDGAADCAIVEPDFREIRDRKDFQDNYLFPLHATHRTLVAGPAPDYGTFLERVRRTKVETATMESIRHTDAPYDLVLSKSVFEHVADVASAAKASHALSGPGSLHLHYIDFTMHYDRDRLPGNPFGRTFERAKSANPEYLKNPGGIVNLLRPSEMIAAFRACFQEVHFLPILDMAGRIDVTSRHADWHRYAESDLTIANGVLVAMR